MSKKKPSDPNAVNESIASNASSSGLNEDVIWQLFKETDEKVQETDRMFKELDKKIECSAREWDEIKKYLDGTEKSEGEIAEDYFFSAIDSAMKVGKMHFNYIDRNRHCKKKSLEVEYDLLLWSDHKVVILEIKSNFKFKYLRKFHNEKLKKFKLLFPQYIDFKVYAGVAGMTFSENVAETAQQYGFFVLTQHNENLKLLNDNDFEPAEVR